MEAMYRVTIATANHLMCIAVRGFWSTDVLPAYKAELARKAEALRASGGCQRILIDMSNYPIQSPPVAQAHARIIAHGRDVMKAHIAIVMDSALLRMQAMRVANLQGCQLFDDQHQARRWLLSQPLRSN